MYQEQLINSVLVWKKRLEIENEQRKNNHLRASNGFETLLKRSGKAIPASQSGIFQIHRFNHSVFSHHSQDCCEKN